jgi:hypothetical protein
MPIEHRGRLKREEESMKASLIIGVTWIRQGISLWLKDMGLVTEKEMVTLNKSGLTVNINWVV